MGEHADYELEEVAHMHDLREQHVQGYLTMEQSFDLGFVDPTGMEQNLDNAYDTAPMPWDLDDQLKDQIQQFELAHLKSNEPDTLRQLVQELRYPNQSKAQVLNKIKTIKLMKAFAIFYIERGFLSAKQCAIVDTNVIGGSDVFKQHLDKFGVIK